MKYGIYYAYWEKQWGVDYKKYISKVAGLGFDALEISCAGIANLTDRQIAELNEEKEKAGIFLTGGYGPKASEDLSSSDPDVVENGFRFWKGTFEVLQKLGITSVGGGLYGCWPVDYSKPIDKERDLETSVRNMRRLADMAADYGITVLGMEVLNRHEGYLLNTCRECVDYVEAVGKPNVKVMLDTYHMLLEEDDIPGAIRLAGSRLGHFHVGENNRRLPGQGRYQDWDGIGQALRDIGYTGNVVMEPFVIHGGEVGRDIRIWRDLLPDTSEEQLDRDAAQSVRFLRGKLEG